MIPFWEVASIFCYGSRWKFRIAYMPRSSKMCGKYLRTTSIADGLCCSHVMLVATTYLYFLKFPRNCEYKLRNFKDTAGSAEFPKILREFDSCGGLSLLFYVLFHDLSLNCNFIVTLRPDVELRSSYSVKTCCLEAEQCPVG